MVRRPLSTSALGLVAALCISAFALSGCVINDAGALASAEAVDSANRKATSAARNVQIGVARGAGDLDEIAVQLERVGVEYLVAEVDYPKLGSSDPAVVAMDKGTDLTATVLVKGWGQAAVGPNAVYREVHGCFNLVFIDGRPEDPEMVSVGCPKWTHEFLMASGAVELAPFREPHGRG